MACETFYRPQQTPQQRKAEVKAKLAALEAAIKANSVTVKVDKRTGALAFVGWDGDNRAGITDACAFRQVKNAPEVRAAILRAEMAAGTKVNERAIAAGVHSHDGIHFGKH